MKKTVIAAAAVIALIATAIAYWALNRGPEAAGGLTLYGNVDIRQVSLAFEEAGRIKQMNVQEGDRVQPGQVLALLDTQALEIQAKQAEAQLIAQQQAVVEQDTGTRPEEIAQAQAQAGSAQAQLDKAAKDLQRYQALFNSTGGRAISRQELDAAQSNVNTALAGVKERQAHLALLQKGARKEDRTAAKAQVEATQANLDLMRYKIAQSQLRAPAQATVRARLLEVGDMASAQKTVYTLALSNPKWVRVYANEADLSQIKMGSAAQVIRDAQPDQPVPGKIGYISSVAEFTPKTVQTEDIRTTLVYEVRVYVQDPDDQLKMGQPVTVKIAQASAPAGKK